MPGLFFDNINRKEFLSKSFGLASSLVLSSSTNLIFASKDKRTHLALLSDTHVAEDKDNNFRGFYPYNNLKRVVPDILKAKPLGVLINGDVARLTGEKGDYENVKSLLAPIAQKIPVYMTMGNHDYRDNFFTVFPVASEEPVVNKHISIIENADSRILLLDSLLYVDKVAGLLGYNQREWLATFLESAKPKPTILFVHHTLGDKDSDLLDSQRLFDVIQPHDQVKAIFYGHSHEYKVEKRGNIHLINLPAVGYNFADKEPIGWVEANIGMSGVDLLLHTIGGNQSQNGQTISIRW